jgi:hypothetical protein
MPQTSGPKPPSKPPAGPQGLQSGAPMWNNGEILFTDAVAAKIAASGAGWVRLNFRLGPNFANWTDTSAFGYSALSRYDAIIDNALNNNLKVLGLLSNEAWNTTNPPPADWQENNVEDERLVGYWKFDEGSGTTASDASGTGNDAALVDSPAWSPDVNPAIVYENTSSLLFDGADGYVAVPHHGSLQLAADVTVAAWVKTNNADGSADVIVSKWGSPGSRNYWLGKLNGTSLAFYVDNAQNVTADLSLINDGVWHHVAGVADAAKGSLTIYVDGVARNTATYDGSSETGTADIHIGASADSPIQIWAGWIDDVRVYARALSSTEIEILAGGALERANGDNRYIQEFETGAARVLVPHFAGKIDNWQVWNEPNASLTWMYPSNFAWLLRRVYVAARDSGVPNLTIVSGGLLSTHSQADTSITTGNTGADYLRDMYNQGRMNAGWEDVKSTHGSYPLDAIGQHLYIDAWGRTTARRIERAVKLVHDRYVAEEGGSTSKTTHVTEFGWDTNWGVSEQTQADNLTSAYNKLRGLAYTPRSYWFFLRDEPAANLHRGLLRADGSEKPSWNAYRKVNA